LIKNVIFTFMTVTILLSQTACSLLGPYKSDQDYSTARNVSRAAGVYTYDVSKKDFTESYGKAISTGEVIHDLVETTMDSVEITANVFSMMMGVTNLSWVTSILQSKKDAEDRQLMLAWMPKGDIEDEDEAWHKLNDIIREALRKDNMPVKPVERAVMNKDLEGDYGSISHIGLRGEKCPKPFFCQLYASKFEPPEEINLPDFLGGGEGYFFEIDSKDASQYFSFNCVSRIIQFNSIQNIKFRNKHIDKYFECAQNMNEAAVTFSKNMPEWFYLYRPASKEYQIGIPHILNQGKAHFFIKPELSLASKEKGNK